MNKKDIDDNKNGTSFDFDAANADHAMQLVATLVKEKKLDEAFSLAEEVENNIPEKNLTSPSFWMTLGDRFAYHKEWENAKEKYAKAIQLTKKKNGRLVSKLAKCHIKLKNYDLAEKLLREHAPDLSTNEGIARLFYKILVETSRREMAIEFLDQALTANPTSIRLWYLSGDNHYRLGNFDNARYAYNKALELTTDKPGKALIGLALTEKCSGNQQAAEKRLEECLEIDPSDKKSLYHCSEILRQENHLVIECQRLAQLRSGDINPSKYWFAYADSKRATKEWDIAKNILRIACLQGYCQPDVFITLCQSELREGNFSQARELLNERTRLLPPSGSMYLHCEEIFGELYNNPLGFISEVLISQAAKIYSFIDYAIRSEDISSPIYDVKDSCRLTFPEINPFTRTVYVFGASQVYGPWSENKYTIPSFLQNSFCSHEPGTRVVNMGVPGQDHFNHYLTFNRLNLKKNDCVIILPHTPARQIEKSYFSTRIRFFQVMASECQAKGVRFAVFHLPIILDIKNPSPREKIIQANLLARRPLFVHYHKQALKRFEARSDMAFEFHSLSDLTNRPHDMGEIYTDYLHFNHRANKRIAEKVFAVLSSSAPEISPLPLSDDIRANTLRTAIEYLGKVASEKYAPNPDVASWIESVRNPAFAGLSTIGAIVMNCNPFTWGHHYLIEQAARQVDGLYIFVVEEDKSFFPFEDRIRLVREGVKALGEKISIHPSGKFIISNLSFSGYFSKERAIKPADSTTDVLIFGSVIAPALNIRHRFVGEEPNCLVTNSYNETMSFLLPSLGVDLHIIPRKEDGGQVISATTVRKALQERDWDTIRKIVPHSTYDYLIDRFQKEPIPSG